MGANFMPLRLLAGASCLPALTLLTALAQTRASILRPVPVSAGTSSQVPASPQLSSLPNSSNNGESARSAAVNSHKPSLPVATNTRPITLEEHADIFLARKDYASAADYYRRA